MSNVKRERTGIYRRGQSWIVRVRRDGKHVWRSFPTKGEAEAFLAESKLRRARRQPEPATTRERFDEFAVRWLGYMKAHVGVRTLEGYEGVLRVHLLPELGHRLLSEITRLELDEILSDWVAAGPRYQERLRKAREMETARAAEERRKSRPVRLGHSPKTVANAIVPLREMLGHAVEWGLLSVNPAVGLRRPRVSQRAEETMRVLDADQVRALLETAAEGQERALLTTAVMTGARRGELVGLKWSDLDRERGLIWVRRSIGPGGQEQVPKTRRSIRAIAIGPTLSAALRDHRVASRWKQVDDFIFTTKSGGPLDGRNVTRAFTTVLERAGLPHVRFHDLRHTYVSLLVEQGAHPRYIADQVGHASVKTTMDRYSHLFPAAYADESAKLEQAIFGSTEVATPAVQSDR